MSDKTSAFASSKPHEVKEFSEAKVELNEVSYLVGQLLTIVDGSFANKEQRDAVKSLVKKTVWDWGKRWHLVATRENIKWLEENSEECSSLDASQVDHLD